MAVGGVTVVMVLPLPSLIANCEVLMALVPSLSDSFQMAYCRASVTLLPKVEPPALTASVLLAVR